MALHFIKFELSVRNSNMEVGSDPGFGCQRVSELRFQLLGQVSLDRRLWDTGALYAEWSRRCSVDHIARQPKTGSDPAKPAGR